VTVSLAQLNALPAAACAELFAACCGSSRWVSELVALRPFASLDELRRSADDIWRTLGVSDWLEAFAHHPRIGGTRSASPQSERAASWSAGEQASVAAATAHARSELAAINDAYENKFGFIYIVSATGKSAGELLDIARARLTNNRDVELRIAVEEQRTITSLRLEKLIMEDP
jgi:OHCU decarboxylase